jgi:hypothetical protein
MLQAEILTSRKRMSAFWWAAHTLCSSGSLPSRLRLATRVGECRLWKIAEALDQGEKPEASGDGSRVLTSSLRHKNPAQKDFGFIPISRNLSTTFGLIRMLVPHRSTATGNAEPLNYRRVWQLLELLRERTPEEISSAVILFAPALTPEMWKALELLRIERRVEDREQAKLTDASLPAA